MGEVEGLLQLFVWNPNREQWCLRRVANRRLTHCGRAVTKWGHSPAPDESLSPEFVCPECLAVLREVGRKLWPPKPLVSTDALRLRPRFRDQYGFVDYLDG
jgi:hypothetical protein